MKNLMFTSFILVFFLLCFANVAHAQERTVKGIVTTFDSIKVVGVEVKELSTKKIVLTDSTGSFSINCLPGDKIRFSAKGFYSQKVKITENIKLLLVNLTLKPGEKSKEIAVGYGYVKDVNRLNSILSANSDNSRFSNYANMYDLIRAQFPSVQVVNKEIIIRGKSSIHGSDAALIVVDGLVVDSGILSTLSPVNVKSVDILQDSGAAIYGSRGTNGVVLITTKKGGE